MTNKIRNLLHKGFETGIVIKGIDGVLEIIGGFLLLFLNPARLDRLVALLTQHELSEDPGDFISNTIVRLGSSFSASSQQFGIFYLTAHGLVKIVLVILLLKKKLWAYPLAVVFLILFISYEIYRFTLKYSTFFLVLIALDTLIALLTLMEYKRIRKGSEA